MPYIGKQPLTGAYQLCDTITTSATATYNLTVGGSAVIPGSAQNCIVSLNGVIQAPVSAFTVSGSQITFASALTSTDVIDFILILGNVFDIGTPTNGSVTNSSLNSNVITGQTAVTVPATDDVLLCYDTSATALRKITFANFGNTPSFLARNDGTTTQSISNNTWTEVTNFNTEEFDTNSVYSTSTCRFTPQVAGKYFFYTNIFYTSTLPSNSVFVGISKNGNITGNANTDYLFASTTTGSSYGYQGSCILNLNGTTDYVSVFAFQTSGGTRTLGGSSGGSYMNFHGYRLIGV